MENLDALLTKIKSEGVTAAQKEAEAIVAKAQKDAEALVAKAKADAEALETNAKAAAERYAQGAEATIRQAARDVVIKLEQDINALFETTLGGAVAEALDAGKLVETCVQEAVDTYLKQGEALEIAAAEKLVPALKKVLAAKKEVTVVTDPLMGTGFSIRLAGGRVEHDFTAASITETLAAQLRPQLAALVKA